ncbi:MAG: HEAT repeat domain-containing protein [Anaerolineae bacterium]
MELENRDDWELLAEELKAREHQQKRKEALWDVLERDKAVPGPDYIEHLSGLLTEEIERVRALWNQLALDVRQELVKTLGDVAEADFTMDFSAIFRIATHDEDPDIRASAVRSLDEVEVEDVRLVPEFVDLLRHDPAPQVRRAAAGALARFVLLGELEKIRPTPFDHAVSALLDSHRDGAEDLDVQRRAIESLAYTGERGVPDLISRAYEDERMRKSALLAMGRSADKRWGAIVQRELRNPNPELRLEATRASGELQLREAVREVIELTEDTSPAIRQMALWSLGQIGGNLARKTLERFVDTDDETLSTAAQEALQELEFTYGALTSFFGPPEEYDGETEELWQVPGFETSDDDDLGEIEEAEDDAVSIDDLNGNGDDADDDRGDLDDDRGDLDDGRGELDDGRGELDDDDLYLTMLLELQDEDEDDDLGISYSLGEGDEDEF